MRPSCCRSGRFPALPSAAALCLAALFAGCATSTLSVDEERQLGADLDRQVRSETTLVRDPVIQAYVERIGNDIVRAAPPQPYTYRFKVVDDAEINAFAGPAGYIYIHTGILAKARNVSEVAGVVAHEVGHVALRHVAQNYNLAKNTDLVYRAGVLVTAILAGGAAANLASLGGGLAAMALVNSFGRDAEAQADAFAVEVLPRAGYDPEGLVTFFQTIQRQYGDGGLSFLESHPAPSDRIEETSRLIASEDRPPGLRVDDGGQLEIIQRRLTLLERARLGRRSAP